MGLPVACLLIICVIFLLLSLLPLSLPPFISLIFGFWATPCLTLYGVRDHSGED